MDNDTTAAPGTEIETIHTRSYERGYQDALNATNECTLRDQFAMAALTGLISVGDRLMSNRNPSKIADERDTAEEAYIYADAMFTARQGSQETDK